MSRYLYQVQILLNLADKLVVLYLVVIRYIIVTPSINYNFLHNNLYGRVVDDGMADKIGLGIYFSLNLKTI